MGRRRKHGKHLPRHVYRRKGGYELRTPNGKWIWYGKDLPRLMADWGSYWGGQEHCHTIDQVFDQYLVMELPKKAPRTQRDYQRYMTRLRPVFGHCRPDDLVPKHFNTYRRKRSESSPTQANRELTFMKAVYRFAICEGWATDNPVSYVPMNRERPRERYVTDEEFMAVYRCSPPVIRIAMALAVITGIRQGDLLSLKRTDFGEEGLIFRQGKTGKSLLVEWSPALRKAYARAIRLHKTPRIHLLTTRSGGPYTSSGFRTIWHRSRKEAIERYDIEPFHFHDLRGKAATDGKDWRLLGHTNRKTHDQIYLRKPTRVKPAK